MKLKRTIGTGKIFLYSCGAVMALAGIIWFIINGIYAVYISGEKPGKGWISAFEQSSVDIVTPWLLMAAAMAVYYRYWKMCSANNVSCTKQTGVFSLLAVFVSAAFAAADLLTAKLVFEKLYGGIVLTRFEDGNLFFFEIINDYVVSLDENVTVLSTPYNMKTLLLLFAFMAVYYYCFFLAGCYIVQCFRCGRKKTLIYYAVTIAIGIFLVLYAEKIDSAFDNQILTDFLVLFSLWFIFIGAVTNPVIFLVFFQQIPIEDFSFIMFGFVVMSAFILITVPIIESVGKGQFPSKRQIKKILKNYNAKIIAEREEQVNDGQT